MKIYVPLVDSQSCQEFYTEHGVEIGDGMFCMGSEDEVYDYVSNYDTIMYFQF